MAVDVAAGDVWRFTLRSTYLGQPVVNSVHLLIIEQGSPLSVTDSQLGNALVNASPSPLQTLIVQACNEELVIREASAQWIYRIGDTYPGVARLTYRRALNVPGVVAGAPMPGQPSTTISAYGQIGAEKAIRGGMRLSGLTEEQIEDGLLAPSFISGIQAEADALYMNEWELPAADDIRLDPIIWSPTLWQANSPLGFFAAVDQVVIRQTPGTIRRRKEFSSTGGYPV